MPPLVVCSLPLIAQLHARYTDLRLLLNGQHRQVARQHLLDLEIVQSSFLFGGCIATLVKEGVNLLARIAACVVEGLSLLDRLAVVGASRAPDRRRLNSSAR